MVQCTTKHRFHISTACVTHWKVEKYDSFSEIASIFPEISPSGCLYYDHPSSEVAAIFTEA